MVNGMIPELVGVLTVRICTQKWPSCLWWITPEFSGTVLFKSGGRGPSMGHHCRSLSSFHQFRLLETSSRFTTAKPYFLGSPSSFPHFEVDDRTLIRNPLGREGNRPDWLKVSAPMPSDTGRLLRVSDADTRSVSHERTWIFDAGIWKTLGGAADTRVAPSRCTAN